MFFLKQTSKTYNFLLAQLLGRDVMIEIVQSGKGPGGNRPKKELPLFRIVWVGKGWVEVRPKKELPLMVIPFLDDSHPGPSHFRLFQS